MVGELVSTLGGKRNALTLGVCVTLLFGGLQAASAVGATWISPGDRTKVLEIKTDHLNWRIDSAVTAVHIDEMNKSANDRDDAEWKRAVLMLVCDGRPAQRLKDLGLLSRCKAAENLP
jgi:hypothetical protein